MALKLNSTKDPELYVLSPPQCKCFLKSGRADRKEDRTGEHRRLLDSGTMDVVSGKDPERQGKCPLIELLGLSGVDDDPVGNFQTQCPVIGIESIKTA